MSADPRSLRAGYSDDAFALDRVVHESGLQGRFTSTLRTRSEQQRLYNRFLAGLSGGRPAAPPGQSAHEYGLAFDYLVSPYEYQNDVGRFWVQNGGVWTPRDDVHFEWQESKALTAQFAEINSQLAMDTPWYGQIFSPGPWWTSFFPGWNYTDILKWASEHIGEPLADTIYRALGY